MKNWQPLASLSKTISEWFYPLGTDDGAMYIRLTGSDKHGMPQTITWNLIAEKGVGPNIPTIPAILLAKKLIRGENWQPGAMPCLGLLSKEEIMSYANTWGIYERIER